MKREIRDYIDSIRVRSVKLQSANIDNNKNVSYEAQRKNQEEQDKLYKKYIWMKNLKKAVDKVERKEK